MNASTFTARVIAHRQTLRPRFRAVGATRSAAGGAPARVYR